MRYFRSVDDTDDCSGTVLPNGTCYLNGTDGSSGSHEENRAPAILFMFACCTVGALVRTVFKRAPIPYTVLLLILGAGFGVLSSNVESVKEFTGMASMDPHIILHAFLPVLIFESAFAIEVHSFLKASLQIVLLAIPGLVLAAVLTAAFSVYVFQYNWTWYVSMMFGAVVSATDPVAVVALLKDLGASKQLGLVIEGESLLNDGASIVVFHIFRELAAPGSTMSVEKIIGDFFWVAFIGPLFGFVMAKLTILWLVNVFNDALTEITITLCSTYLTFYIGEEFLKVSGVLAVVALGLCLSAERTSISPEVEKFLHRFWEMLAYLANTLIFLLVGVVITERAIQGVDAKDWVLLLALYCTINVIRAIVIGVLSPLLRYTGYGLTWRNATIMTWGGLRGAVGLALALIVYEDRRLDETGVLQSKVLLHCAGIVMLTLLVNATTIGKLLSILGMSDISMAKRLSMASAVRTLHEVAEKCINTFKSDRFLADADWILVEEKVAVEDPYKTLDAEADMADLTSMEDRTSTCPSCQNKVPSEPTKKEMEEMRYEARMRLLKAQKTSYWKQFEHGMLSREAVRKLVECVDTATDTPDGFVDLADLKKTWQVKEYFSRMKRKLEEWRRAKMEVDRLPVPENSVLKKVYYLCSHQAFELVIYFIVFLNIIMVFVEFGMESELRCGGALKLGFDIINYFFITLYVAEAILKIMAFRKHYFLSHWNQFDVVILLLSFVDVILDQAIFASAEGDCEGSGAAAIFNPSFLKVAKIAKIMRLLRILRGLKTVRALIPSILKFINSRINVRLRFGYDVGKGYVMGEEEVHHHIPLMVDNRIIALELREQVSRGRIEIMKELGLLQKEHPGIAVSVKTQQATRRVLNNLRDKVDELRGEGVLDELESSKIELVVEKKMKKLLKMPSFLPPPPPERVICNLSWIKGDSLLMEYIRDNAQLVSMQEGETLFAEGDPKGGIYIIVSGLIKVDSYIEDHSDQLDSKMDILVKTSRESSERIFDYLTTGSVLGEISLLTNEKRRANVTSETSTQLYHVGYEAIQGALELFTDEPSLEYRLWNVCATRLACGILKRNVNYKNWSMDRIKLYLEKGVLYLHRYDTDEYRHGRHAGPLATFEINSLLMSDIILIHGVAEAAQGREYRGPCYIPQIADTLTLLPTKTDKHVLLIVPRGSSLGLTTVEDKAGASSVMGLPPRNSNLCLRHSSMLRSKLSQTISQSRMSLTQKSSKHRKGKSVTKVDVEPPLPGHAIPKQRASMFGGLGRQQSQLHQNSQESVGIMHSYTSCEIVNDRSFYDRTLGKPSPLSTEAPASSKTGGKDNEDKDDNVSQPISRLGKLPPIFGTQPTHTQQTSESDDAAAFDFRVPREPIHPENLPPVEDV